MADLTASRALVSDSNGDVSVSDVTSTEIGYLDGVTSAVQTQIDNKATKGLLLLLWQLHYKYINIERFKNGTKF